MFRSKSKTIFLLFIISLFFSPHTVSLTISNKYFENDNFYSKLKNTSQKNNSNNLDFKSLPETKDLIEKEELGKIDPFSFNRKDEIINQFNVLKLLGVFSTSKKNYALIKYNNETGQIEVGDIGGENTILLPEKVLVKDINIKYSSIILELNDKEYQIKLD